jgi:hypothetical protein
MNDLKKFILSCYYACCKEYNNLIELEKKENIDKSKYDYYQGQISAYRIILLKM